MYIYMFFWPWGQFLFTSWNTPSFAASLQTFFSLQRRLLRAFCKTLNCLNSGSGCVLLTHWWETKVARPIVASKRSRDPSSWEKNDQVDFEDSGRVLGQLAWAALSRADLSFPISFLETVFGLCRCKIRKGRDFCCYIFWLLQDSTKSWKIIIFTPGRQWCYFNMSVYSSATRSGYRFSSTDSPWSQIQSILGRLSIRKVRILWINSSWTLFGSICYFIACFIFMKTPNPRTTNLYSQIVA